MDANSGAIAGYVATTRRFSTLSSSTEETYPPPICACSMPSSRRTGSHLRRALAHHSRESETAPRRG
jgi:hypothetical protein